MYISNQRHFVDEWQQMLRGGRVVLLDGRQDLRDFGHASNNTARVRQLQHAGGKWVDQSSFRIVPVPRLLLNIELLLLSNRSR